ncbi:AMP-binding protein [Mediterraneibacter sp. NSJ-55]|uniref:AMP-binding protein n=1 Tax=Mediterraneibacter hominis TaxID=2763054 RepID=A0A923LKN8_9FIRM|nr:AMP-binding protein [Mediterraneibacter hominis]MBC5689817.1 AMP-binding protein [Mediterraneibacter hominis]
MWDLLKFRNNDAIIDEYGSKVSYDDMERKGKELMESIGGRCLVFSLCRNSIGSVIGYVTFINHGIVPVMLNESLDKELLEELLNSYKPKYLWLPSEQTEYFSSWKTVHSSFDYTLLRTPYEVQFPLFDELALLLTTSGSTGSPKFVRQSYTNIRENTRSIVEYLKLDDTERAITTLPMNYTYGLSIINTHLMAGATLLLTDKSLMQKEFWQFFKDNRATSFGGVPYTYEMLKRLRFMKMELPSLRTMTQAGGKLTEKLHEEFARFAAENKKNFVVMYGQCEATARMGYLPPDKAIEKKGSMGVAIPGGTFSLIDTKGEEVDESYVTGELVYKGPNVTLGYAECGEDLAKGDERGGILHTGDMAQFDDDGYFYIVGRKKRFLKIYGNRVNLDEMERMIKGAFEDINCACAGMDDSMYIFITEMSAAERIKEFVVKKTKLNAKAFHITVIDEIPQNDAGKTLYKELERYYEEEE